MARIAKKVLDNIESSVSGSPIDFHRDTLELLKKLHKAGVIDYYELPTPDSNKWLIRYGTQTIYCTMSEVAAFASGVNAFAQRIQRGRRIKARLLLK